MHHVLKVLYFVSKEEDGGFAVASAKQQGVFKT